jgi:putative transposase
MPNYRRLRIAGGRYFFTVNLADRRSSLLTDRALALRHAVCRVRALAPFGIDARVVVADHMHAIWTLPEGDSDFPRRWRAIKDLFSRHMSPRETLSASRSPQGERGIWQRRYWEHAIRDDPPELRPLQPCETQLCFAPHRLAILDVPSVCRKMPLPARLARLR